MNETYPSRPLVSIVTPSLNGLPWLEATIRSVLDQDYRPLEYIVMDGGSQDGTLDLLRRYADRLTWYCEPDSGISNAINKGWARARGSILAWLGSDDLYEPGAVSTAVTYLNEHPKVAAVYGDCAVIDIEGRRVGRIPGLPFDRRRILGWNYIPQQTVFMQRWALEAVGWLDEGLNNVMDHDLWIKFALREGMVALPQQLAHLRVHAATVTNRAVQRAGDETIRIVSRTFADPDLPPDLRAYQARALAEAYLRAGMCYYAASDLPGARRYLLQALRLAPPLLVDRRFARTLLTSLLGTRLMGRLRRLRQAPHRATLSPPEGI